MHKGNQKWAHLGPCTFLLCVTKHLMNNFPIHFPNLVLSSSHNRAFLNTSWEGDPHFLCWSALPWPYSMYLPAQGYEGILPLSDACIFVKENEASCKGNFLTTVQLKNYIRFLKPQRVPPQAVRFQCKLWFSWFWDKTRTRDTYTRIAWVVQPKWKVKQFVKSAWKKTETCLDMYKDLKEQHKRWKIWIALQLKFRVCWPPFFHLEYGAYSKCNSVRGQL